MKIAEKPMLSIIMIVKNGQRFIGQALKSILAQEYRPFELILIDGNSTDNTLEIAAEFKDIKIIHQNVNGISNAYNMGINAAKSEFISFLSHDDLWTPNKLQVQMDYMIKHPEILFTNCHTTYFIEAGTGIPPGFRKEWLVGSHPARIMETLVARKTVFEKVGFFNPILSTAEDVDWYSRAAHLEIPSAMLPDTLLKKRIHGQNSSMELEKNNSNLLRALREAVRRKHQN